jgi:hypothetical protein
MTMAFYEGLFDLWINYEGTLDEKRDNWYELRGAYWDSFQQQYSTSSNDKPFY